MAAGRHGGGGSLRDSSSVPPVTSLLRCRGERRWEEDTIKDSGLEDPGAPEWPWLLLLGSRHGVGKLRLRELPLGWPGFAILHGPVRGRDLGSTANNSNNPLPHPSYPSPGPPTLLSRASIAKGNRCFLEQNAVYAEQVEINLHQLFQSMAGGLLMATYQPFRGEMIYCQGDATWQGTWGLSHLPQASITQHLLVLASTSP